MRARASSRGVLALAALLVAGTARADRALDYDDERAVEESFWGRIAFPDRAATRALLDRAALAGRDGRAADAFLRAAIELAPGEPLARYRLGRLLLDRGDYAGCASAYAGLADVAPGWAPPGVRPADLDWDTATCLTYAGRLDEAIPALERVLASGTRPPMQVHYNLGICYHNLGRLDEAIAELGFAVAAAPGEVLPRLALGVALDRDEQGSRATDEIEATFGRRGGDPVDLLRSRDLTFLVPEDRDYWLGLVLEVKAAAIDPSVRPLAVLYFRRFLAAPGSPWAARAAAHLAALGPPVIGAADVAVPADLPDGPAFARAVGAVGPALSACVAAQPLVSVRAELNVTPPRAAGRPVPGRRPAPPPSASAAGTAVWRVTWAPLTVSVGPKIHDCVRGVLSGVTVPAATRPALIGLWIVAATP